MAHFYHNGFVIKVLREEKDAASAGVWPTEDSLFIPVTWQTLPFLYGVAQLVIEAEFFSGTEAEKQAALQVLEEQTSEPPLTITEVAQLYGARFQSTDGSMLEVQEGEGYPPPPWEWRLTGETESGAMMQFRSVGGGA